ncbi:hypothetical protein RB614_24865 [Phytohabitans sp. ZYX-F-186]|uniref:Uncharacterized protein n=1 Tax=Phytohabitans maris TaxID=3071409 RepID=A0ABU0ZL27_9ACTN|nr:hypothetical protein [Phytohabitans sp. ZYX-F-186]MDQ7907758.1 hypothetical protein [Phytohabitans sp. ZYX-F-186]
MLDERTLVPELPELPWQLRLGLVFVDEKPTLFALYRRDKGRDGEGHTPGNGRADGAGHTADEGHTGGEGRADGEAHTEGEGSTDSKGSTHSEAHAPGGSDGGGRVAAWLMVLPGDQAVLIPADETPSRPIVTTLRSVQRRWLRLLESELVQVVGPQAQHML